MTIKLTFYEYFTLKLLEPTIDVSSLIEILFRIKTPNVREFIHIKDYEIYKKQCEEIRLLNIKLIEKLKKNDDICFTDVRKNHLKIYSYYLLPNAFFWQKAYY
jgi:hypothetical protein